MIPLTEVQEERFASVDNLLGRIASRGGPEAVLPLQQLSLGVDGCLRFDSRIAQMTPAGFGSLLDTLRIPATYATEVCDEELLADSVNRLARRQDRKVKVHMAEGKVENITDAKVSAITNQLLVEFCRDELAASSDITLAGPKLRIIVTQRTSREILPGDTFASGWELTNCEAASAPLQVRVYTVRLLCTNGAISTRDQGGFRRAASQRGDVLPALTAVRSCLQSFHELDFLEAGIKRASETPVGTDLDPLQSRLRQVFGADGYEARFATLSSETTWFDVYNHLTAAARMYSYAGRRMLEELGGDLMNWFASGAQEQGLQWRGLRHSRCSHCELRERWLAERAGPAAPGLQRS